MSSAEENDESPLDRSILYYPYIKIENGPWLRHALLYWDKVASIVPRSLDERTDAFITPEMQALRTEGIFRPVRPRQARMSHGLREALTKKFIAMVNSPEFEAARSEPQTFPVHVEKFEMGLKYELERSGLAASLPDASDPLGESWNWIQVGKTVGLLYLSLLAKTLCFAAGNSMVPGTDEQRYEDWLFPRLSHGERMACLDVAFQRLLPVPAENVPLDDIVRFRRKHRDSLLRFRKELDRISLTLAACDSPGEVRDVLTLERESLELGMMDLKDRLKRSGISGRLANLKMLVGLAGASALATVSTPLGAMGAVVTVASSLREASDAHHLHVAASALSYVHNARDEGILL